MQQCNDTKETSKTTSEDNNESGFKLVILGSIYLSKIAFTVAPPFPYGT